MPSMEQEPQGAVARTLTGMVVLPLRGLIILALSLLLMVLRLWQRF